MPYRSRTFWYVDTFPEGISQYFGSINSYDVPHVSISGDAIGYFSTTLPILGYDSGKVLSSNDFIVILFEADL